MPKITLIAMIIALVLGVLMIALSVWKWYVGGEFGLATVTFAGLGVCLVGFPIWRSIEFKAGALKLSFERLKQTPVNHVVPLVVVAAVGTVSMGAFSISNLYAPAIEQRYVAITIGDALRNEADLRPVVLLSDSLANDVATLATVDRVPKRRLHELGEELSSLNYRAERHWREWNEGRMTAAEYRAAVRELKRDYARVRNSLQELKGEGPD
jgi:hypothetical protein